ncbi:MAG: diaminopimelate decarboxylase family protein, partial [Vicinamibacterales bacterium]
MIAALAAEAAPQGPNPTIVSTTLRTQGHPEQHRGTTTSSTAAYGLAVDGVSLFDIAAGVGTPCYVYSAAAIRDAYTRLETAFGEYPHAIHYALKANSSLAIVRLLKELGSGIDANSMGEVDIALRCGFAPEQIMFTGVGKSREELSRAIALRLKAINVESPGELERLDRLAREQGVV